MEQQRKRLTIPTNQHFERVREFILKLSERGLSGPSLAPSGENPAPYDSRGQMAFSEPLRCAFPELANTYHSLRNSFSRFIQSLR